MRPEKEQLIWASDFSAPEKLLLLAILNNPGKGTAHLAVLCSLSIVQVGRILADKNIQAFIRELGGAS